MAGDWKEPRDCGFFLFDYMRDFIGVWNLATYFLEKSDTSAPIVYFELYYDTPEKKDELAKKLKPPNKDLQLPRAEHPDWHKEIDQIVTTLNYSNIPVAKQGVHAPDRLIGQQRDGLKLAQRAL